MKVLIIGHSGSLGLAIPKPQRMPVLLDARLKAAFPEQEIDVQIEPWKHMSDERLDVLIERLESYRPDYFVFDPVPFWVSYPLVNEQKLNRTQARLYGMFQRLRESNTQGEEFLLRLAPEVLIPLQETALRWTEHGLFAAQPVYSVSEAMAAMERLTGIAMRLEPTGIFMLGSTPESIRTAANPVDRRRRYIVKRFFPGDSLQRVESFVSQLLSYCSRQHITFIETTSYEGRDWADDKIHRGSENAIFRMNLLFNQIQRLESAYAAPRPVGSSSHIGTGQG